MAMEPEKQYRDKSGPGNGGKGGDGKDVAKVDRPTKRPDTDNPKKR